MNAKSLPANRQVSITPVNIIGEIIQYKEDLDKILMDIPDFLDLDEVSEFEYHSPSLKTLESCLNNMNDYIEACTDLKNAQIEGPDKIVQLPLDPELKQQRRNLIRANNELSNVFQNILQCPTVNQCEYTIDTIDPQVSIQTNELNNQIELITPLARNKLYLNRKNQDITKTEDSEHEKNRKSIIKSLLIDQFLEKKSVDVLPKHRSQAFNSAKIQRNSSISITSKPIIKQETELEKAPETAVNVFSNIFKEKLATCKGKKKVVKVLDPIIDYSEIESQNIKREDPKYLIELNKSRRAVPKLPPKPVEKAVENPPATSAAVTPGQIGKPAIVPLTNSTKPKPAIPPTTNPAVNLTKAPAPGSVAQDKPEVQPSANTPVKATIQNPILSRNNGQTNLNSIAQKPALTVKDQATENLNQPQSNGIQPIPLPPESSWNINTNASFGINKPNPLGGNKPTTPFGQNTAKQFGSTIGTNSGGMKFGENSGVWNKH